MLAAAASVFLPACHTLPETLPERVDAIVLEASLPRDVQSKAALGERSSEGKYDLLWQTGDQISINGTLSAALSSTYNDQKVAEFTVSGIVDTPYKVLYPGSTSVNTVTVPAEQAWREGSFEPGSAPAYGNAVFANDAYTVHLTSFCAVLRFDFRGAAVLNRIELNCLGSEKISGDFTLATDDSGFTGAFSGGTSGSITLTVPGGKVLSEDNDTYVFIPVPAQAYAQGFEALVYDNDGSFMRLKFFGEGKTLSSADVMEFALKTYVANRTENLLTLDGLTAEEGGEPTAAPPGITVATFNVMRLDSEDRPSSAVTGDPSVSGSLDRPANAIVPDCAEMQAALGTAIKNTGADLIGFQEIGSDMYTSGKKYSLQDIATAQGAAYTWKLDFPSSDSGNYHYSNGFAYKASVLTLNSSGRAWLRSGSTSYSTSSDSGSGDPNRYVVWGLFTHKASGKQFYFFVTQLPTYGQDGGSGTSNLNMSGGVNEFAATKTTTPNRQILVGDMNSVDHASSTNQAGAQKLKTYWTDAYEAVEATGNMNSFYLTYSGTQSGTGINYQYEVLRFCKNHPERRLDHIMTNGACTAQSYKTIRNTYQFTSGDDSVDCAPSDHLPVVAYITLD